LTHDEPAYPPYLTIRPRLLVLGIYIALLFLVARTITGEWLPTGGRMLWFASSLGLWCFTLLSVPFFQPPREALASALTAALLLVTIDLSDVQVLRLPLESLRWIAVGLATVTVVTASVAIVLYRTDATRNPRRALFERLAYRLSRQMGKSEMVFTPSALIGIVGFYQDRLDQALWLVFLWVIVTAAKPIETIILTIQQTRLSRTAVVPPEVIGTLQRVDDPGIVRVNLDSISTWRPGNVHSVHVPLVGRRFVLPLFHQVREHEVLGTGLLCGPLQEGAPEESPGSVCRSEGYPGALRFIEELAGDAESALVGFVVENSRISSVQFEVAQHVPLEEGQLVFCRQGGSTVYYQILDARTTEESFDENPRGTHVVMASQLGTLQHEGGFRKYGWLPAMNTPVFRPNQPVGAATRPPDSDVWVLGTVPGSQVAVTVNFSDLVEFHAAVLGATGRGKTELVFDVIREALARNIKVLCVDFTGEYLPRLAVQNPTRLGLTTDQARQLNERLFDVETGAYSAGDEKRNLQAFVEEIKPLVEEQVQALLEPDGPSLGVFELEDIANTRATLRATELYLSTVFRWARGHRRARRILVVLEEAHTVVPEMNLYGYDRVDTGAVVGRIAQIALQGRKYGVGLLLVSQRTALVSKTVLSQCNTCLTFSLVDRTSLEYLSSVYSEEHVRAIPNLRFLEVLAFGKAVNSERPIIAQVPYDEGKVRAAQALNVTLGPRPTGASSSSGGDRAGTPPSGGDEAEDIPF